MRFTNADPALIERGREIAKTLSKQALQDYDRFIKQGVLNEECYWGFLNRHPGLADIIREILVSHSRKRRV